MSKTDLPSGVFAISAGMRCYATELGATMLVEGEIRVAPDGVVWEITVWSAAAQKFIFRESGIFPMTDFMEGLFKIPASLLAVLISRGPKSGSGSALSILR